MAKIGEGTGAVPPPECEVKLQGIKGEGPPNPDERLILPVQGLLLLGSKTSDCDTRAKGLRFKV
ncbi:hypothetical protein D9M68_824680 [compost metagenome]